MPGSESVSDTRAQPETGAGEIENNTFCFNRVSRSLHFNPASSRLLRKVLYPRMLVLEVRTV